jgi:hypothetical protein
MTIRNSTIDNPSLLKLVTRTSSFWMTPPDTGASTMA